MKKTLFAILALTLLLSLPAVAEFRLDAGIMVPRGVGQSIGDESSFFMSGESGIDIPFLPLPEAGIYYQADLGSIKVGAGLRAFTAIIATVLWPNVFAEMEFGRVVVEAQIGGGSFTALTIEDNFTKTAKVFIPDISAWYEFGAKRLFRLGGGVIGAWIPDFEYIGEGIVFLIYLGGKVAIPL